MTPHIQPLRHNASHAPNLAQIHAPDHAPDHAPGHASDHAEDLARAHGAR